MSHIRIYPSSGVQGYFVSPDGNASWGQATGLSNPTDILTAFANARAGDKVYFRNGTYNLVAGDHLIPTSGTTGSPVTFQNYPGEIPILNGHAGVDGIHANGTIGAIIFPQVTTLHDIIYDGFVLQSDGGATLAAMQLGDNDYLYPPYPVSNITIRRCSFNGGTTLVTGTDNAEGIWIRGAQDVLIDRCKFFNYKQVDDNHNTSAYKNYHVSRVTIRNCEFYTCTRGIYDKSGSYDNAYEYNYFHDCPQGGLISPTEMYGSTGGIARYNLFRDCAFNVTADGNGVGDYLDSLPTGWTIEHNTFYQPPFGSETPYSLRFLLSSSFRNNLIVASPLGYSGAQLRWWIVSGIDSDYNGYGNICNIRYTPDGLTGYTYTPLSAWRATTVINTSNPDIHGIEGDPLFTNGSGLMNVISDFNLASNSPYKNKASDGLDIGCDPSNVGVI